MIFKPKPRSVADIISSFTAITNELDARIEEDAAIAAEKVIKINALTDELAEVQDSQEAARNIKANFMKLLGK